ncbi:nitroreductase/quinone reductase family protein [Knoellia aerolata]|uniref:Uncharacterized protein n=1 Tax=Knoellia aerolata DSM 18566 TaxID=1385519 RepID=A0A0A0JY51_9MICO|nr:nitroreductase/quinone reductase family protein [Knoellia aerolata]KGN42395.1 hypothetical protein N801_17185 [Knoellia aerolata DSM 18566]
MVIQTFTVEAQVLTSDERDAVWPLIVVEAPDFGAYQNRTERVIPVVRLRRVA